MPNDDIQYCAACGAEGELAVEGTVFCGPCVQGGEEPAEQLAVCVAGLMAVVEAMLAGDAPQTVVLDALGHVVRWLATGKAHSEPGNTAGADKG